MLDAQKAAPQTPEGAVSFAIAYARWIAQKPTVPAAEQEQLRGVVTDPTRLAADVASFENAEFAQFHITSSNGYYRVESFDDTTATVTLMLPLVVNSAVDPTLRLTPSTVLEWGEAGWMIAGEADTPGRDGLATNGVTIPGGC